LPRKRILLSFCMRFLNETALPAPSVPLPIVLGVAARRFCITEAATDLALAQGVLRRQAQALERLLVFPCLVA